MLINVDRERIERWCAAIGTPATREGLNEAVVRVVGEEYPDHRAALSTYIAAQPFYAVDVENLPYVLYQAALLLSTKPHWIGAPREQIAIEAEQEARHANRITALHMERSEASVAFEHMLNSLAKERIYTSNFYLLTDVPSVASTNEVLTYPQRRYGEHALHFTFIDIQVPTDDGWVQLEVPVYIFDRELMAHRGENAADQSLFHAVQEQWMAKANGVGHDDLHHMYYAVTALRNGKKHPLPVSEKLWKDVRRDISQNQDAFFTEPVEQFSRTLHADRVRARYDCGTSAGDAARFVLAVEAMHANTMAHKGKQAADDAALFFLSTYMDNTVSEHHRFDISVYTALVASLEKLDIARPKQEIDAVKTDRLTNLRSIVPYPKDVSQILTMEPGENLKGGQLLLTTILHSGSNNAQYAAMDGAMRGMLFSDESMPAKEVAMRLRNALYVDTKNEPLVVMRVDKLKAAMALKEGYQEVVKEADEFLHRARLSLGQTALDNQQLLRRHQIEME